MAEEKHVTGTDAAAQVALREEDEGAPTVPFALRLRRAALHLDMSERTFFETKNSDGFPKPVFYGGQRRWVVRELEEWVLQHRRPDLKLPVPVSNGARGRRKRKSPTP